MNTFVSRQSNLNNVFLLIFLSVFAFLFPSCQKVIFDEEEEIVEEGQGKLTFRIQGFNTSIIPFSNDTRAGISDYCTKLVYVVYDNSGKKISTVTQESTDSEFGKSSIVLEQGDYKVLILGHSSKNNPTLSNPEKIQFTNDDGFSDTFYYYGNVSVTTNADDLDVNLERCTSMLRLIVTNDKPSTVTRMRFYYEGGSGALNAVTGYGCVNSKQTVYCDYPTLAEGEKAVFNLFTILKAASGTIKFQVQALDADGNEYFSVPVTWSSVPMQRNKITELEGPLFKTGSSTSFNINFSGDWAGSTHYNFN